MADFAAETAIVGKVVLAILLVLGGIYAIYAGQRLFREGVGLTPGKSELKISNQVKFTTTSIGGVLMLTAVVWGWLGKDSLPTYKRDQRGIDVAYEVTNPKALGEFYFTFAPDQSALTPPQMADVEKIVEEFKKRGSRQKYIAILGTAVPSGYGDASESLNLANARAETLKAAFTKAGVSNSQISVDAGVFAPKASVSSAKPTAGAAYVAITKDRPGIH